MSIAGTVTYADGSVVYRAKVNLSSGEETYTDRLGRYSLRTRASERLTVSARDGFTPGWVYGTTYSGSVSIAGDRDRRVDLRLVVPTPF